MSQRCISIVTLSCYTLMKDFDKQSHLIFLANNYANSLLNEIEMLQRSTRIENQHRLDEQVQLLDPDFKKTNFRYTISEMEQSIKDTIRDIMQVDIDILKFIRAVPDQIVRHAYQLPSNYNNTYLVKDYNLFKEERIITTLSKTLQVYENAQFDENFIQVEKLSEVYFNNNQYTSRLLTTTKNMDQNINVNFEYHLLVDFCDKFFHDKAITKIRDITSNKIPTDFLRSTIEIRQILYVMQTTFSSDVKTNGRIKAFFRGDENVDVDIDESVRSVKRPNLMDKSLRESKIQTFNFMALLVYLMSIEENNDVLINHDKLPKFIEEYKNQAILTLNRMIEHLLEYIQFQSKTNRKILYSKLPLVNIKLLDARVRPITQLIYMLQYALNYAPFLFTTD